MDDYRLFENIYVHMNKSTGKMYLFVYENLNIRWQSSK